MNNTTLDIWVQWSKHYKNEYKLGDNDFEELEGCLCSVFDVIPIKTASIKVYDGKKYIGDEVTNREDFMHYNFIQPLFVYLDKIKVQEEHNNEIKELKEKRKHLQKTIEILKQSDIGFKCKDYQKSLQYYSNTPLAIETIEQAIYSLSVQIEDKERFVKLYSKTDIKNRLKKYRLNTFHLKQLIDVIPKTKKPKTQKK